MSEAVARKSMTIFHVFHYASEELGGAQKIIHDIHREGGESSKILAFDYVWDGANRKASSLFAFLTLLARVLFLDKDAFLFLHHRMFLPVTWFLPNRSAFVCHNIFPSKNRAFRLFGKAQCIAISEEVKAYLLSWNPAFRVTLIPNGMAEAGDDRHRHVADAVVDVGFVGRLDRQKGLDLLVEAARRLVVDEGCPIRLHLVGPDGDLGEALRAMSADGSVPEGLLQLYGYHRDPFALMRDMDLLCIPSRYEGFGLVYYEALERNHFILAADLPVFHAYDWDRATVFFEADRLASLTEKLRECCDRALRGDPTADLPKRHAIPTEQAMAAAYLDFARHRLAERG